MTQIPTRREELEQKIADLQTTLHDLKRQLHEEVDAGQHEAIDHLEEYLEQADHKYANLREFLVSVLNEIRDVLGHKSDNSGENFKP